MHVHCVIYVSVILEEANGVDELAGFDHRVLKELIHLVKPQTLLDQILTDVRRCEYILQIDPLVLQLNPRVHYRLQLEHVLSELLRLRPQRLHIPVPQDHVDIRKALVQAHIDLLHVSEDGVLLLIRLDDEVDPPPHFFLRLQLLSQ